MGLIIICGYGTAGKAAVSRLERETGNLVIIDRDESALHGSSHTTVIGDATEEDTLRQAGIDMASALIATAGSDVINSFITLTARSIKPDIAVYTVAERMENIDKLYRAGADHVVQESLIGARELVDGALGYSSGDSRVYLGGGSELHVLKAGKEGICSEVMKGSGSTIVAIRRGKRMENNPKGSARFSKGDVIYAVGSPKEIGLLKRLIS